MSVYLSREISTPKTCPSVCKSYFILFCFFACFRLALYFFYPILYLSICTVCFVFFCMFCTYTGLPVYLNVCMYVCALSTCLIYLHVCVSVCLFG